MNQKEAEEDIKGLLGKLESEVSGLERSLEKNYKSAKKSLKQHVEMTKLMIETYGIEYDGKKGQKETYDGFKKEIKYLQKKAKDLMSEYKQRKKVEKSSKTKKRAGKMQKNELIQLGDKMQEKGIGKLEAMNRELDEDNKLINEVNIELQRQGEVLQAVDEDINDINSTLKRAQKHISYFAHEYYKDKFIRIMIILIALLLIIIIITAIVRKNSASNEVVQDPPVVVTN